MGILSLRARGCTTGQGDFNDKQDDGCKYPLSEQEHKQDGHDLHNGGNDRECFARRQLNSHRLHTNMSCQVYYLIASMSPPVREIVVNTEVLAGTQEKQCQRCKKVQCAGLVQQVLEKFRMPIMQVSRGYLAVA
jgi:hypothetical protein